jgi:pyruvate,water dikinase
MKEGAIIISRVASPDLAVGMAKARAVATGYGGQAAAASWFAREYAIPAVVGVSGLVETVKDGDIVRVDGNRGTVEMWK